MSQFRPRGKTTAYGYFVQICREEHKKNHPEEAISFGYFSKRCAERWSTMSDKQKSRFYELAENDKKRYEHEMMNYVPVETTHTHHHHQVARGSGGGRKRKHAKDPNAPKRALTAFFWYCNDERAKVKQANPDYGVADMAKELGRRWSEADPALRSKYEDIAAKDKARYEQEMVEYRKRLKMASTAALEAADQAAGLG